MNHLLRATKTTCSKKNQFKCSHQTLFFFLNFFRHGASVHTGGANKSVPAQMRTLHNQTRKARLKAYLF